MPISYPFYKATGPTADSSLTESCPSTPAQHDNPPRDPAHANSVCGDWAVNTIAALLAAVLARHGVRRGGSRPRARATIGDRLSAAGRSWAWYAGGWSNADGTGRRSRLDERHGSGPARTRTPTAVRIRTRRRTPSGRSARTTCSSSTTSRSTTTRRTRARARTAMAPAPRRACRTSATSRSSSRPRRASRKHCGLRDVSFIKPVGAENEHPGYASEPNGSNHLVDLLKAVEGEPVPQGHDGDRDLRRVRRPVGPHAASGPGRHVRPARRLGPRHAHPGADDRAGDPGQVRRGPREARHDVDHGHDRASLRSAAGELARRGGA